MQEEPQALLVAHPVLVHIWQHMEEGAVVQVIQDIVLVWGGMSQHGGKGGNRGESGVQPGGGGGAPSRAGGAGRCNVIVW